MLPAPPALGLGLGDHDECGGTALNFTVVHSLTEAVDLIDAVAA
jgi:hypothetical protein